MTFSSIMITFYPTITGLCHAYFVIFDQNVICCIPENVIIRISREVRGETGGKLLRIYFSVQSNQLVERRRA